MVNETTTLKQDPAPGITPEPATEIRTDQHNLIRDILNGEHAVDFVNMVQPQATKTGSYTMTKQDFLILADGFSAGFTITLPDATATAVKKKIICIKKIDNTVNKITIDGATTQTIDSELTIDLEEENECVILMSDETDWQILARFGRNLERKTILGSALTITPPAVGFAKEFFQVIDADNVGKYSYQEIGGVMRKVQIV